MHGGLWVIERMRPLVMGILNVTPDSFSDGRLQAKVKDFLARAVQLLADGADILDVGGESTRPGAPEVSAAEEIRRLKPVLEWFRERYPDFPLSLDTRKLAVFRAFEHLNIHMVNDTSCLADPELARAALDLGAYYVLMHARGTPQTMAQLTQYDGASVTKVVMTELWERVRILERWYRPPKRLILDPGFGFAKTPEQCVQMMTELALWPELACELNTREPLPLLFAVSRKRFLQHYTGANQPHERDGIGAALAKQAVNLGFNLIRTHNVALTRCQLGDK